jgi:hypothetical protein
MGNNYMKTRDKITQIKKQNIWDEITQMKNRIDFKNSTLQKS